MALRTLLSTSGYVRHRYCTNIRKYAHILMFMPMWTVSNLNMDYAGFSWTSGQWRRQDLLRGGAKMKIMSWGTHGGLQGRVQQLLDD